MNEGKSTWKNFRKFIIECSTEFFRSAHPIRCNRNWRVAQRDQLSSTTGIRCRSRGCIFRINNWEGPLRRVFVICIQIGTKRRLNFKSDKSPELIYIDNGQRRRFSAGFHSLRMIRTACLLRCCEIHHHHWVKSTKRQPRDSRWKQVWWD